MAFADTGGELFRLLRVLESGDRTRLIGENYGLRNGNALGAYQMGASSLIQIGAVRAGGDVNRPADWTGRYGTSAENFLATRALQERACLAYMNLLDARLGDAFDAYFGTRQNGAVVTRSGALLCSWENPQETRLAITGKPFNRDPRDGLADYTTRMQFGSLVEAAAAPVPVPVAEPIVPEPGAPSTGEGGEGGPEPPMPLGL